MKTVEEQEFELTVWSLTGRDMPSLDRFLAGAKGNEIWEDVSSTGELIGKKNRENLLELRDRAFLAYRSNDMPLLEMTIEALFLKAENIGFRWVALPKAIQGAKQSRGASKAASAPRKVTEEKQKSIAKSYWKSVQEGTKYGAVKALAAKYEISTQHIRNIAKKYPAN